MPPVTVTLPKLKLPVDPLTRMPCVVMPAMPVVAPAVVREPALVEIEMPAPVLDPLPRWVRADVLTTGDLVIAGTTVPGEGGRAREVQRMLESGAGPTELARAGVGWLVVQRGTPGQMGGAGRTLQKLSPAYEDADIALYRVGGASPVAPQGKRIAAILAHLVWAAMVLGGAAALVLGRLRQARQCCGR